VQVIVHRLHTFPDVIADLSCANSYSSQNLAVIVDKQKKWPLELPEWP